MTTATIPAPGFRIDITILQAVLIGVLLIAIGFGAGSLVGSAVSKADIGLAGSDANLAPAVVASSALTPAAVAEAARMTALADSFVAPQAAQTARLSGLASSYAAPQAAQTARLSGLASSYAAPQAAQTARSQAAQTARLSGLASSFTTPGPG